MGRFGVVGLFLLAVLVVTYAFLRSDGATPALSAEGGSGQGVGNPPADTGEPPAVAEPGPPTEPAKPERNSEPEPLRSQAAKALEKSESATTREKALEHADRARRLLSQALLEAPTGKERDALRKEVEELSEQILFADVALPGMSFLYTIQPGDRLWTLCNRVFPKKNELRVEPGFLLWMNGLSDARHIQEGQVLKVPTEELSLRVVKSRKIMQVLLGGAWIREYRVGVGEKDRTPEGKFEIETKKERPAWYHQGRKIPFGHPENPLGTRWMGFRRIRQAAGYGIHGTDEPKTIGQAVSQGCIRMLNEDVEQLFEWVPRGTGVTVVR